MLAIGTEGLHPASASCLEALQWLHEKESFTNILEIGCGNGILALAAASVWGAPVLACDISAKAVEDTKTNAMAHGLEERVTALRSDGFGHPQIAARAPYDLILCNLLAELQLKLALDAKKHCSPGGVVLLSGILAWKTPETEQVYTDLGFEIIRKTQDSPWVTLLLRHRTDAGK